MRKLLVLAGLIAAIVIPATALAVDLNPSQIGSGCSGGGDYHFVAPGGSAASRLTVDFSGTGDVTAIAPTKVTGGTAHWNVDASGTVLSASATNVDRLRLSDFTCDEKKDNK